MMASRRSFQVQPDYGFGRPVPVGNGSSSSSSPSYSETPPPRYESQFYAATSAAFSISSIPAYSPMANTSMPGPALTRPNSMYSSNGYNVGASSALYGSAGPGLNTFPSPTPSWEPQGRASPDIYLEDLITPSPSDYALDSNKALMKTKQDGKGHTHQRRPSNRDEFDGPHQFLQRPPPEYVAAQERDLPHLPTNLVVQEQDAILTQVNDRLSRCAFDFVAKYQFPIPLANGEMRPVERPQDREWTEWVYLLKRLATKRRIPARVLYNGQIKQFITILENSLEMRHAAKHQSRPLKDDRNILQLISAGIQVAKILRDSSAMVCLDQLYVATERQIQERAAKAHFMSS